MNCQRNPFGGWSKLFLTRVELRQLLAGETLGDPLGLVVSSETVPKEEELQPVTTEDLQKELTDLSNMIKDLFPITEEQFIETIAQAIKSGDFTRHITIESGTKRVIYEPYRQFSRMQSHIDELEVSFDELEKAADWPGGIYKERAIFHSMQRTALEKRIKQLEAERERLLESRKSLKEKYKLS